MQMLGPELRRKVLASAEIVSVSRKQELQFCIGGGSKQDPDCFYFVREGELVVNDCSTHGAPVEITCLKARLLVACMAVKHLLRSVSGWLCTERAFLRRD